MREFGSEHPAISIPDGYFESLKHLGREVALLRSGREALLYVSRNCKPKTNPLILIPAYCCWSMSAPFEKDGWRVEYYRLNEDLTVDLQYLEKLIVSVNPEAVLTMNYYGSADTSSAVALIKSIRPQSVLIEDFSHCTFSIKAMLNPDVDFYVSSIRKSLGVCDGAVVLSKGPLDKNQIGTESSEFSDRRYSAQSLKEKYSFTKNASAKESFLNEIRECEAVINDFSGVSPISNRASRMLDQVNGEDISYARKENAKHLFSLLNGRITMITGYERCFDGVPFSLPILVDNRDAVQQRLADRGVYAPVLWPISESARSVCPNSAYVADHLLSLPIDQRYDWDDMESIAEVVLNCCK